MAGVSCARRSVAPVPEQDHGLVVASAALLDTPPWGRHLMFVGEKVYEGLRHIRSGQGSYPSPSHGSLLRRASFPASLALDCNAASSGLRTRGTTIKEFAP